MSFWSSITALGDSAVLLPSAGLILAALCTSERTRGLAWRWVVSFIAVAGLVAASKLIFMGWGWGIRQLDFIGLSGHSAMAALVWPCLLGLLCGHASRRWRWLACVTGLSLALLVAVSRLILHVHSAAEVIAGFATGSAAALLFLSRYEARWQLSKIRWLLGAAILIVFPLLAGQRFPSEKILRLVAQQISLDGTVYTRRHFHQHASDNQRNSDGQ
ncbi:phosphatase PAP2 family protein [Dyella sp. C11]|uniref:phosphatase PAP2 family protein n=1 Tax=Dyella sp. C11 TaxID=2126991 RepID=UPI000D656C6F|nr:phosphatase PAP2 family protein [Dyella sp. C11]